MNPKVLIFSGSLRSGSFNRQLAQAAAKTLALMEAEVTTISLADYPLPLVDEDLARQKGVPENAVKLARLFAAHDALFIACPEYNASIPPLVKNAIDWVGLAGAGERHPVRPFEGLTVALGAASTEKFGGIRGLSHLRDVMMRVGAQVVTEEICIAPAQSGFGDDGMPSGERDAAGLRSACRSLIDHCTPGRGR